MNGESETLNSIFQTIFDERDETTRRALIDRVLSEHHTVFTRLARELISRFGLSADWADDVRQIVRTAAWEYLREPLKPGFEVSATIPCIRRAARAEVQRMRQSTAYTGVSGAVSARRRQSAISKHRMDLIRTLGYEPDDQSVIDSYNEKVTRSRTYEKARAQGALATPADLELPEVTELDAEADFTAPSREEEVEIRELLVEILRRCMEDSEQTGMVAQVVLGDSMDEQVGDMEWNPQLVARQVELSSAKITHAMQRVRAIAVQVIDEWGLAASG